MNSVMLQGNLTKVPQVRKTGSGTSVANFSVAVNEEYVKNGEKQKVTTFVNCECWGYTCDVLDGLTTRDKVVVVGALKTFVREEGGKPELVVKATNISVVPYKAKKTQKDEELEVVGASSGESGGKKDGIPF